jgi:organic radical activating enzyme
MDRAHPSNYCGGNFQDWLEVNLTEKCNGRCAWCIEKQGWHPSERVDWKRIAETIGKINKRNVILLGGEPTLFKGLQSLIRELTWYNKRVYITTNGSRLSDAWCLWNLQGVTGVNVSIHHWDLEMNRKITGVKIWEDTLKDAIIQLHTMGAKVRLNCNCIKGYIDTKWDVDKMIWFAQNLGFDSIRFAEMKNNEEQFVDLAKIMNYQYGLNDDPYRLGCNTSTVIDGMPVSFRQMCGMQTKLRPCPKNPERYPKQVVYYDGKVYDGWQIEKEGKMTRKELERLLEQVRVGEVTAKAAAKIINAGQDAQVLSGGSCRY